MGNARANVLQGTLDLLILKALSAGELHGLGVSRRVEQLTGGDALADVRHHLVGDPHAAENHLRRPPVLSLGLAGHLDVGDLACGGGVTRVRGLEEGDVVVEVSQEEVKSPADVAAKVEAVRKAGRKSVLLLVERAGELRFVALRLG